jgi:hypothetical protein
MLYCAKVWIHEGSNPPSGYAKRQTRYLSCKLLLWLPHLAPGTTFQTASGRLCSHQAPNMPCRKNEEYMMPQILRRIHCGACSVACHTHTRMTFSAIAFVPPSLTSLARCLALSTPSVREPQGNEIALRLASRASHVSRISSAALARRMAALRFTI